MDGVREGRQNGVDRHTEFCGAKQSPRDDCRRLCLLLSQRRGKIGRWLGAGRREGYPDPTAEEGNWSAVDLVPVKALARPVALSQIKADKILREMKLAKEPRLSVSPVTRGQFEQLLKLAETKL